jgi:hypothetical protein
MILNLIAIFLLLFLAILYLSAALIDIPGSYAWTFRCFAVLPLFAIFLFAFFRSTNRYFDALRPDRSPGEPVITELSPKERSDARKLAIGSYVNDPPRLRFLQEILTRPTNYIERVFVDAEIQNQCLLFSVALTINVPDDTSGRNTSRNDSRPFIVPVTWVPKGSLLNNLSVEDGAGNTLPLVSQVEVKAILSLVIESLFRIAYLNGAPPSGVTWVNLIDLRKSAWMFKPVDEGEINAALSIMKSFARNAGSFRAQAHEDLAQLCLLLAANHVLIAEVKTGSRVTINYKKNSALQPKTPKSNWGKIRARTRLLLGVRPYRFDIPLDLPHWSHSYHFRMNAEPGQYVSEQYLIYADEEPPIMSSQIKTLPGSTPYIKIGEPSGLPYTHLNLRNFAMAEPFKNIVTVVKFSETPPGILGLATVAALAVTVLLGFFAAIHPIKGWSTELPTFILALVIIGASWLGISSDKESLIRAQLAARFGLLLLALILAAGAFLYIGNTKMEILQTPDLPRFSVFGNWFTVRLNLWWFLLTLLSFLVFLVLFLQYWHRTRRFLRDKRNLPSWVNSA